MIQDWNILNLLCGPWFWSAFLGWIVAQIIKMCISFYKTKNLDLQYLVSTGGMPSAHSSLVCALLTSIGLTEGFDNPLTMAVVGFASITMFDAAVVRRAAGKQAKILNQLLMERAMSKELRKIKLKELLGHTRREVFAGMVTGMCVAVSVVYAWSCLFKTV